MPAAPQTLIPPSYQAASAGVLAALVGFASSFAIVIQGLSAAGASQPEATSGLMVLSITMGISAIVASFWFKIPASFAWSTPGAALLATSGQLDGGFSAAVGAFLVCGFLITAAGLVRPFGRAVAAIPSPLANAMLAGVLFGLCLAPVKAVSQLPFEALLVIGVWAVAFKFLRLFAVPLAMISTFAVGLSSGPPLQFQTGGLITEPILVLPTFSLEAIVSIGLPLFIVTMASQNIPGIAVLRAYGYQPRTGSLFTISGIFSLLSAPFGGHAVNLAAITAAMCANEDAHPDPAQRYWAAITGGIVYILFGLFAGVVMTLVAATPAILIEAVAGLALLGALAFSISEATKDAATRDSAIITFAVTASGISFLGVSGAFWGLLAGGAFLALTTKKA
ncbi:benzoate transporter BenE [Roseibium denhamense]|uniref:Benzoate membrane transport protein n=1 Tax=Roseibium denhamense TaxID=76305 RepID=A0ABY1NSS1_9HYPH|nr:benzoate/H(+) symporter BenE family transporter [Roseibium denhamense]MTI08130.1 benzoate transporter BenE [Roseibium denhamense]SMP16624.1 benzoate membrane transport protein [Roseibium denhamense]